MENKYPQPDQQKGIGNCKQVKVSVSPALASAFKEACAVANDSMASKLTKFMADFAQTTLSKQRSPPDYSTRRQRRAAIQKMTRQLERIRDCEEQYRDRIPENLQGSSIFDKAEEFLSILDEAIDILDSIGSI
jgi:hypothetical protein